MKRILSVFCLLGLFLVSINTGAQELRCNVSVSGQKLENSNRNVFRTLQKGIYEFMNNRKWTNNRFAPDERIECSVYINIDEQISSDQYSGSIHVQTKRPVFGSSYRTTLLNLKDNDFQFQYVEFQPIEFKENAKNDNLTNVLAYYAYTILGFDYDSFSEEGGTEFFQKAQSIVNMNQSVKEPGWKSFESDHNRYWLVENMLNKSYAPFRDLLYRYHRQGLDIMTERAEQGRAEIADALKDILTVYRTRPALFINQIFFDAKADELVGVFSKSNSEERTRVLTILNECDPSEASKYDKIKNSSGS